MVISNSKTFIKKKNKNEVTGQICRQYSILLEMRSDYLKDGQLISVNLFHISKQSYSLGISIQERIVKELPRDKLRRWEIVLCILKLLI